MDINKSILGRIIFRVVLTWVRIKNRQGFNTTVFEALEYFINHPENLPRELLFIEGFLKPDLLSSRLTIQDGVVRVDAEALKKFKSKLQQIPDDDIQRWKRKL